MSKRFILLTLLGVSGILFAGSALVVEDAWIRYLPGDGPMAGYFVLGNPTERARTLVGASSPAFAEIQLHRTVHKDGMSSMEPVAAVHVAAHGSISFQPGGYHLMLLRRTGELAVGDEVRVTLEFADGGAREALFAVKPVWQE